ncbi:MAG: hypothetical protein HY360_01080 [Verrucomicrobia bacterium]|nr:hypothetical protein [Verrucomicrobiota bacterium]
MGVIRNVTRRGSCRDFILCLWACLATGQVWAAELLLHYDVDNPNSWDGRALTDLAGVGAEITPSAGEAKDASYGIPVLVPKGAGPGNRAYLEFKKYGALMIERGSPTKCNDALIFNEHDPARGLSGYSLEGYFNISATEFGIHEESATPNSCIGSGMGTGLGNRFLVVALKGSRLFVSSRTEMVNPTKGNRAEAAIVIGSDIDQIIPRDTWFHVVKVFDPRKEEGEIRWFIDGELAQTDPVPPISPEDAYPAFAEWYGSVGGGTREVKGIGYSLVRVYAGVLTADEVMRHYREVIKAKMPVCRAGTGMSHDGTAFSPKKLEQKGANR